MLSFGCMICLGFITYALVYVSAASLRQPVRSLPSSPHIMAAPVIADGATGDQNQAIDHVFKLCSLPLPTDSHPNIHASPCVIDYRVDVDAGFCDRNAFVAAMAKYLEEAAEQAKMVLLLMNIH